MAYVLRHIDPDLAADLTETLDEFTVEDGTYEVLQGKQLGRVFHRLWTSQGVGLFVCQAEKKFEVFLLVANSSRAGSAAVNASQNIELTAIVRTTTSKKHLLAVVEQLKTFAVFVTDLRLQGYHVQGDTLINGSFAVKITVPGEDRPFVRKDFIFGRVTGRSTKSYCVSFRRAILALVEADQQITAAETKQLPAVAPAIAEVQQQLADKEEFPAVGKMVLRLYPELDFETLELVIMQATSLIAVHHLDCISAVRRAYSEVFEATW